MLAPEITKPPTLFAAFELFVAMSINDELVVSVGLEVFGGVVDSDIVRLVVLVLSIIVVLVDLVLVVVVVIEVVSISLVLTLFVSLAGRGSVSFECGNELAE